MSVKKQLYSTTSIIHLDTPLALTRHMIPQIQELLAAKWFQTAREYFTNPPEINIIAINTKDIKLLDILGELREYLSSSDNVVLPLSQDNPSIANNDKYLRKIRGILDNINPKNITRIQRRALRKYIEINPLGREILKGFYSKIIEDGKIVQEMELIFNPYTSLVNLAEIHAQCTEYSLVRYSVPELGIQQATIHLYYPAEKRNEYLAQQKIGLTWLPDALSRICFFNRLLGTKKQPRAIHLFLANFRKEFMHVSGKSDLVFTPSEINTGVCNMTDIIITRSEESLKTLLHELIHFHELDFKHAVHDELCSGLFNITTEQSSFNLFEAHTECIASILHCLTRTVGESQAKQQTDKEFITIFQRLLIAQIYYTMCKSAQILSTSGCYSYDEFITPSDRQKCQLRENTNVFSYFFVKSFIYLSLKEWLISCCDQGTARFIDTHDGQETLKQIIQSGYENKIPMKIINTEILKNHTKTADKSLKMMVVL